MNAFQMMCLAGVVIGGISFATAAAEKKVESKDPPSTLVNGDERKISDQGTVLGKVAQVGKDFVEVTSESGKTARYVAPWKGGAKGGPDKEILAVFAKLKADDPVKIDWYVNDHLRIKKIEPLGTVAKK